MQSYANDISVVIPTYKRPDDLYELIGSIVYFNPEVEIIVVDNNSGIDYKFKVPVKLINNEVPGSLARSRNLGAKAATRDFIFFIDDDNVVTKDTLKNLYYYGGRISAPIAFNYYNNQLIDVGAYRYKISGFTKNNLDLRKMLVDEVSNAFMIHRSVFKAIGYFDEENFPIDLDEADFCLRAREYGYTVNMVNSAIVKHKSNKEGFFRREINAYNMGKHRILLQKKHLSMWELVIYFSIFFPIFILYYITNMKIKFIKPFIKGVKDGICSMPK